MNRLFRHIALIILSGLFLTGCAYDDTVRELREQDNYSGSLAIEFNNGLIDKPVTTKATTLLSEHSGTMGVWGWQTTIQDDTERLFQNQEVTFNDTLGKWTYSPVKYWESHSSYRFYAYAPHSGSVPGVTAAIDSATHAISFKGITLQGNNTLQTGVPELHANFAQVDDVDWMLDRTGQNLSGSTRSEVMFNMQHILAKICVKVCRSNFFLTDSVEVTVIVDSLKIGGFVSQGDFDQTFDSVSIAKSQEWTLIDTLPRYTMNSTHDVSIADSALYIMESLLIPQYTDDSQYVQIWYSIGNKDGFMNHFNYVFRLNQAFRHFDTGCNYILSIVLGGPEPITFNGGVSSWDNYTETSSINTQQ